MEKIQNVELKVHLRLYYMCLVNIEVNESLNRLDG